MGVYEIQLIILACMSNRRVDLEEAVDESFSESTRIFNRGFLSNPDPIIDNTSDMFSEITKLLEEKSAFTTIFAFSDMIAWEAIHTLNRFGKQVPQDIAVVGFDNIQSKLPFPMPLTTISTFKSRMSRHVVDILMKKINAREDAGTEKVVIETKLVVRGST